MFRPPPVAPWRHTVSAATKLPAGRDGDALVMDGFRVFNQLLRIGLLLLDGTGEGDAVGFQVGDRTLQTGNRLGVGGKRLLLGVGGCLGGLRGRLGLSRSLLRRLQLRVAIGKLLLQRVDLAAIGLLLLPQLFDLILDARSLRRGRFLVMDACVRGSWPWSVRNRR